MSELTEKARALAEDRPEQLGSATIIALCDENDALQAEGRELRSDHTALRALTAAQAARICELEDALEGWRDGN